MVNYEPGTLVQVTLRGTVTRTSPPTVDSDGGGLFMGISDDPSVRITAIDDPNRPTLDLAAIQRVVRSADHNWSMGSGMKTHGTWTTYLAEAVLELIVAAHPEWKP